MIADIGHWQTKASFSGDENLKTTFNSLVGEPKFPRFIKTNEDYCLVDPSAEISDMYYINPVLENGIITKESRFQELISHLQNENKTLKSQDFGFFLSEPLFAVNEQKRLMAKIIFEEHKNPFIAFYPQPLMSLFSKGISNGVIVEMGHGMTQIAAAYEGFRLSDCFKRENSGGKTIDDFLRMMIKEKGLPIPEDFTNRLVDLNAMKEQLATCTSFESAKTFGRWNSRTLCFEGKPEKPQMDLKLPDDSTLKIDNFSEELGEVLFRPEIAHSPHTPVHELLCESFNSLDINLKRHLKDKIYISGGTSLLPGFEERLTKEINALQSSKVYGNDARPKKIKQENDYFTVNSVGHATHSVFIGASIICNASSGSLFITSKEYEDMGEHGIFRRFN